jgi:dolichol-phosphate mannosyltransferase
MLNLSLILPVLDERENLEVLIPRLIESLSACTHEFEILVVDDSSMDGTPDFVEAFGLLEPRVKLVRRISSVPSLPQSLLLGVREARFGNVAWMDADNSMPPESLEILINTYSSDSGSDSGSRLIVVGSRFVGGGGFKGVEIVGETGIITALKNVRDSNDSVAAVILSRLLNWYLWLFLGRFCRDLASGFIVTSKECVLEFGLVGAYGDYCARFLYRAHLTGVVVREVPYVCQVRAYGESKTGTNLIQLVLRGLPYVLLPWRIRCRKFTQK